MCSNVLFVLLCFLIPFHVIANFTWLTVVLVDFKLREKCAEFWNEHNNCANPSFRVIANLGSQRFASSSWPISENLFKNEKLYFTTQWRSDIESVLLSSQIEGENALNPFGLAPKCDHGFASFVFNQTAESGLATNGKSAMTRVANIDSQCFSARLLIRIDDECPHCQKEIKIDRVATSSGILQALNLALRGYNLRYICIFFAFISILSIAVFVVLLDIVYCSRVKSTPTVPLTPIPPSPPTIITMPPFETQPSAKFASIRQIPTINTKSYERVLESGRTNCGFQDQEDCDSPNTTYGYELNTQIVQKYRINSYNLSNSQSFVFDI